MNEKKVFNIFKVAGIQRAEEIHTSVIAELINPHSKFHNHGQIFLNAFIERIGKRGNEVIFQKEDFNKAHVKTEVQTYGKRRIDMVISSEKYYVTIEVKIDADDQEAQLLHYYEFAKLQMKKRDEDMPPIFYLTPSGGKPTDKGRGVNKDKGREGLALDKIKCISFKDDILPWLEECIQPGISNEVLQIMEQLRANISDNFNFDKNEDEDSGKRYDLLPILYKKISDQYDRNNSRWTENKDSYLTFRLKKDADLEFALRIDWNHNKKLALKIICGYGSNESPNYADANSYIKMNYGKFVELLEKTFIHTIYINPSQSVWARYEEYLIRQSDNIDEFADECFSAVVKILSNCSEFAPKTS